MFAVICLLFSCLCLVLEIRKRDFMLAQQEDELKALAQSSVEYVLDSDDKILNGLQPTSEEQEAYAFAPAEPQLVQELFPRQQLEIKSLHQEYCTSSSFRKASGKVHGVLKSAKISEGIPTMSSSELSEPLRRRRRRVCCGLKSDNISEDSSEFAPETSKPLRGKVHGALRSDDIAEDNQPMFLSQTRQGFFTMAHKIDLSVPRSRRLVSAASALPLSAVANEIPALNKLTSAVENKVALEVSLPLPDVPDDTRRDRDCSEYLFKANSKRMDTSMQQVAPALPEAFPTNIVPAASMTYNQSNARSVQRLKVDKRKVFC